MKDCGYFRLAIVTLLVGFFSRPCLASPPFFTDDPQPVDYKHWEVYLASQYLKTADDRAGTAPHIEANYGAFTRLASIPLLINISVAIVTTKIPMLSKQGVWATAHEVRTDFCMVLSLIFLIIVGGGSWSFDSLLKPDNRSKRAHE